MVTFGKSIGHSCMVNLLKVKAYIFAIDSKHTRMQFVSFAISRDVRKLETPARE